MNFPAYDSAGAEPNTAVPNEGDPFKDSGAARKAVLELKGPVPEGARDTFLAKVSKSPAARHIAFSLLSEGWKANPAPAWGLLRTGLKDILAQGREFPSRDVMSQSATRKRWLSAEFGITGKIEDSARYNAGFAYLWPLYVILSFPDNEGWLGTALDEFMTELDASLEVGAGKSGKPKKARVGTNLSRTIALEIVPLIQSNPLSIKPLRTHLRLASMASQLGQIYQSEQDLASRQNQVLERLLSEERAKVVQAEHQIASARTALAEAQVQVADLSAKLAAAEQQRAMQQGIAEMRVNDALVQQRAELRFKLRHGLENIKLYTDRAEPARDRILRLCDELIVRLDGTTQTQ